MTGSSRLATTLALGLVVIGLAVLDLVVVGAGATPAARALAAGSDDYRIGDAQPVDSINPFNEQNEISFAITSLSYDLLLDYRTSDAQPDLAHSLARSYRVSKDGRTWHFTLRSGVTWSDGKPFTSADVKWTYDAVRENTTNVMNAYLTNVAQVRAPTKTTVVLRLSSPDVRISSIFVPILPRHVFDRFPVKKLDSISVPLPSVTTAPFQITSYDKTGTTILTRNPRFRGTAAPMRRVLVTRYGNEDSLLRDLKLGALDMVVDGNTRWASTLRNDDDVKQWSGASPGFSEIAFNSCPPGGAGQCSGVGKDVAATVVQDPAIRTALAYGINRENLAQTAYAGQVRPAYGLISPYYTTYFKDWSHDPRIGYRYNPAKARRVLAAGGWDCHSNPCTKNGTRAEFTLDARTNDEPGQNAMRRVVAWAGQIGIKINLSILTEDALNNKIYAPGKGHKYAPDFDAFYWAWTGDPTPDFDFSVLQTGSVWSDSYYSNRTYDALTRRALRTVDQRKRVDLLHRAEKVAMTDLPYIPTVYANSYDLTRTDTWHDYQPSPAGSAGSPIGTNWLQLTSLQHGPGQSEAAVADTGSAGGVPVSLVVAIALLVAGVGFAAGRRGRPVAADGSWMDGDDGAL